VKFDVWTIDTRIFALSLLEYKIAVMTRNGLSGAVVSDREYPTRVSYSLINKILEEFTMKYPDWRDSLPGTDSTSIMTSKFTFPELGMYLKKFQNPQEADSIMRVQKELDETKEVLVSLFDESIHSSSISNNRAFLFLICSFKA
jgi:hypothetical protein